MQSQQGVASQIRAHVAAEVKRETEALRAARDGLVAEAERLKAELQENEWLSDWVAFDHEAKEALSRELATTQASVQELVGALERVHAILYAMPGQEAALRDPWKDWTDTLNICKEAIAKHADGRAL